MGTARKVAYLHIDISRRKARAGWYVNTRKLNSPCRRGEACWSCAACFLTLSAHSFSLSLMIHSAGRRGSANSIPRAKVNSIFRARRRQCVLISHSLSRCACTRVKEATKCLCAGTLRRECYICIFCFLWCQGKENSRRGLNGRFDYLFFLSRFQRAWNTRIESGWADIRLFAQCIIQVYLKIYRENQFARIK